MISNMPGKCCRNCSRCNHKMRAPSRRWKRCNEIADDAWPEAVAAAGMDARGQDALRVAQTSLLLIAILAAAGVAHAQQPAKTVDTPVTVRYTDIRKAAGIKFLQDSTQTDQKYYLETMGTGVGWMDYDQDGLMTLYSRMYHSTNINKPLT